MLTALGRLFVELFLGLVTADSIVRLLTVSQNRKQGKIYRKHLEEGDL
jgi:hypothetical protein